MHCLPDLFRVSPRSPSIRSAMLSSTRSLALLIALFLLTGCTHYEFNIVSPADLRQHIGVDRDVRVTLAPIEYRLRAYEDHLVIQIYNRSNEAILLLSDQSAVVDPQGESHAVRGKVIAPEAYIKLILPPMPHYAAMYGPGFGLGVGYGYGFGPRFGGGFYDPFWDGPRYVAVEEPGVSYWRWEGLGNVRLLLAFQQGGNKPFTQQWTFSRVSVR
jgi:hypothetical protein